jgi:hypothetical protein
MMHFFDISTRKEHIGNISGLQSITRSLRKRGQDAVDQIRTFLEDNISFSDPKKFDIARTSKGYLMFPRVSKIK